MIFLYKFLTTFLLFWIVPISYLIPSARIFFQKRRRDKKRILAKNPDLNGKTVFWFHAASVGELDQCKALALEFRKKNPSAFLLQSVFSESVRDSQLEAFPADETFRLPIDTPFSYDWIFSKFHPKVLVLMAWDTWPNLILTAKTFGTKVVLGSAVIGGRKQGFMGRLTKAVFRHLDGIYPSHETFYDSFRSLVPDIVPIKVLGDTRFDTVIKKIEDNKREFRPPPGYPYSKIILFASTYEPCESLFVSFYSFLREKKPDLLNELAFWIFPHKTSPDRIVSIEHLLQDARIRYQTWTSTPYEKMDAQTIVFDVLGVLAFAYQAADFAYVGGAIHNRVHNVLEPALFGLPLMTGPNISNSPEATILRKTGGLFVVSKPEDILDVIDRPESALEVVRKHNRDFVRSGRGAAERLYEEIKKL
ncbi:3-deoxy-D-manno-octulosonic acid transferase [Leptospira gomenensis]|uniref:3-deoxy-D-manno-octulosonic acid transferase n=1 Tax=Leptospira gomenensis TaxID=2484974 RepID=A0A5F1Y9P3_9LEPT|nr:glycosyltransferase N-terminal domain-containing protein [Leptospira gomenensis]TGK31517.1 3-deoxy-D-manno-octulosonic acid transferase [Leptospira gomenensis]TGK44167.1 3-deoxy-D-manno-octulosonic acid transferase [Leptospira gomenensis]TGK46222.1 3-deoxy-D-manno-octulosonic acid transferase [Leptospira gomenensis]TGK54747.1 3-deoxy-D-manno-octulosonic acid transferase [Leptospira gomenensis]